MEYNVYQQRFPYKSKTEGRTLSGVGTTEYESVLRPVGKVVANSGEEAIEKARELPVFKAAAKKPRKMLTAFPIVERIKTVEEEREEHFAN